MTRLVVRSLLALALLALGAETLRAQGLFGRTESEPGWIGISFQVQRDRWGRADDVVITDVSLGSPAERAGVRAGDVLRAVNDLDRVEELEDLGQRLRLTAGDPVVMVLERDGEPLRLRLRAEARPAEYDVGRTVELRILQSDSMVETWARAMDSLRVELVAGRGSVRVRGFSASGRTEVRAPESVSRPVRAPFEFFVFRGEAHDSLRREMEDLNRITVELERRIETREETLARRSARRASDEELRDLRRALEEASRRSARLEVAMAEEARTSAGRAYVALTPGIESNVAPETRAVVSEFRPLTPYLLGRNRVAGAQVIDLKPELAEYFRVEDGVLVVDVASRTPAAIAGILPGDVIVRIDEVRVRSVEDLRFGVSVAGDTLPISLIRQGESVQVLLRR